MRSLCLFVVIVTCLSATAFAKDPKPYQSGTLLTMSSVHCGTQEKDATSALGEIIGTDNKNKKSQELLCQEYVLQSDTLIYHIRPRDEKHPELLPVGNAAEFRLQKDKLLLHVDGLDTKDHEYIVVSMTPRTGAAAADPAPPATSGRQ